MHPKVPLWHQNPLFSLATSPNLFDILLFLSPPCTEMCSVLIWSYLRHWHASQSKNKSHLNTPEWEFIFQRRIRP